MPRTGDGSGRVAFKASRYNASWRSGPNHFTLVNTRTAAVLRAFETSPGEVHTALLHSESSFTVPVERAVLDLLSANGFIVAADFDELAWLERLHKASREGQSAFGIGLAVTLACNFRCTYCYQLHEGLHMPEEVEEAVVRLADRELAGRETLRVRWCGGEPLLRVESIRRAGDALRDVAQRHGSAYDASITTNGYLLDESTATALVDAGVLNVQVTLDGPPDVHDQRRQLADGGRTGARILENVLAVAPVFRRFIVRINVDRRNAQEAVGLLGLLAPVREAIVLAFRPTTSPEQPNQYDPWSLQRAEWWGLNAAFSAEAEAIGLRVIRGYAVPGTSFCSGYQRNSLAIDPYGDAHLCPVCVGRREQRFGELTLDGRVVTADGPQNAWAKWSPFEDSDCRECVALPVCMGGCLWYLGQGKAESFRCWAKHGIVEGIAKDPTLSGWIRAAWEGAPDRGQEEVIWDATGRETNLGGGRCCDGG